ncbi:MAG: hypothetical protein HRF42_05025 [Candidatus Brocadia sp.]
MRKCNGRFLNLLFTLAVASMPFYAVSQMTVSHVAEPSQIEVELSEESAYQKNKRDQETALLCFFRAGGRV